MKFVIWKTLFKYGAQFTKDKFALFEGACNDHIF